MDNKPLIGDMMNETAALLIGPGAAPLPKLDQEASALLAACNTLLNSLALQRINIPPHLLSDLSLFCRNELSFGVPFSEVAKRAIPVAEGTPPEKAVEVLGKAMVAYARDLEQALISATDPKGPEYGTKLLSALAEMEIVRERLCGYFGWSRILIAAKARSLVDERGAASWADGEPKA